MDQTLSNVFHDRGRDRGGLARRAVLHVVLRAGAPTEPPSRHLLDGIEQVSFGRGPRGATRTPGRLELRVPDPVMSSDHGRLIATPTGWLLEDPRSKNGAVVAGRPTRCAPVRPGDVFELGHTLLLLEEQEHDAAARLDATLDELPAPAPALATFAPALAREVGAMARVAASDVPVLLLGESGTGKEVMARALHDLSRRRGAFVAVNCGALVPQLVEAELFGHKKGAFSGAVADRAGYIRSADRGTLFLDELGDLPLPAQAALLRVLQEREVVAVGDATPVAVDFRVCAATHRDLPAMVARGEFREDLYARLLGVTVHLPALRERRGDLGALIGKLLARAGGASARLTPAAAYALLCYRWPLNIRELERTLAAAVAMSGGKVIDVEHLPAPVAAVIDELASGAPAATTPAAAPAPAPASDDDAGDDVRRALIDALTRHQGNVAAVARDLGKGREQVHRWARRFGLDLDAFRR